MANIDTFITRLKELKVPDGQVFRNSGHTIWLENTKRKGFEEPKLIQFQVGSISSQCGGFLIHSLMQNGKVKKAVWLGILQAILSQAAFAIFTDVVDDAKNKCFVYYKKLGVPGMIKPQKNPNTSNRVNVWVISAETIPAIKESITKQETKKSK